MHERVRQVTLRPMRCMPAATLAASLGLTLFATAACIGDDPVGGSSSPASDAGAASATSDAGSGASENGGLPGGDASADGSPSGTAAPAAGAAKVVFVTADSFDGALGGVSGADAKCQAAATAAGLSGTYLAWVATRPEDAPSARFAKSKAGYARSDSRVVAASWNDLVSGQLAAPIDHDEHGAAIASPLVWSNTAPGGGPQDTGLDTDCDGWTNPNRDAIYGDGTKVDSRWTLSVDFKTCSSLLHLYCFQQ